MVAQLIRSNAWDPKETLTPSSLPCKTVSLTHPFPPMQVYGTFNMKPFLEWAGLHGRIRGYQTDRERKEESLQEGPAQCKGPVALGSFPCSQRNVEGF